MTTPAERAKQLTEAHWNGYVKPTLETHFLRPSETRHDEDAEIYSWRDIMRIAEHHYCTSGIHFYVHAVEDCRNGMFDTTPHDGEGSDLYLHGNLCPSCAREKCNKGQYPATSDGGCEGYIPALRERMLDAASPCDTCATFPCDDLGGKAVKCSNWKETVATAKQDVPKTDERPLDLTLPPIMLKCTAEEAAEKFWSERDEWKAAKKGSLHELVERWDCLQALYTFAERGGDVEWYQDHVRVVMEDLARYQADGRNVMEARRGLLLKNAKRGYYHPDVNARIIATNGHRFTP